MTVSAIVALDPDLGASQFCGKAVKFLQRCRQMGEVDTRKAGEVHFIFLG
jgi:hypothetical protein